MNQSVIRYILGRILRIEGLLFLLPAFVGLLYHEKEGLYYLLMFAVCFAIGFLASIKKPKSDVFYLKEGCVTTALSWILLGLFGCVPFFLTGEIPNFVDALFETISGLTTTGASILSDVEALSHASLFWRSFTHWIGGMGVLVFMLAVVPLSGGSNINLMRAESPGPSVGKLVPRVRGTARALYIIYFVLTLIEFILLLLGHMPLFDAICTSMGTAGTGGFGIKNSSISDYSIYCQWVITIFMILFGINFNAYYLIILRQFKKALAMEEIRTYLAVILVSIILITANIYNMTNGLFDAVTQASFQVASIITTTGFSTANFDLWPTFSKTILVLLMFVGACAGSTGGGIKVSRFIVAVKTFLKETLTYIHPKSIRRLQIDNHPLDHEVIRSVNVYLITYTMIFVASLLLISTEGKDMITTFTSVAATINNIGPGLCDVGPIGNYYDFSIISKIVMIFDMLAGRLELFPLLILFHPAIWRSTISHSAHH